MTRNEYNNQVKKALEYYEKANIVLIEGLKNGGDDLKMMEPIYVYDENGNYTNTINRIYRRDRR